MKNIIRCRIRIIDFWNGAYSEETCYGLQLNRMIKVDGRTFVLGRKKETSVIETINGNTCMVSIDSIEKITGLR